MKAQEFDALLTERVNTFDLKKKTFDSYYQILLDNTPNKDFLGGFEQSEITPLFDGYQYLIDRRYGGPIIRTRIGMYVPNEMYPENLEPIGYYELETDLDGEIVDDWFIIEQEKYLKDIRTPSFFQYIDKIPTSYLRRNHIQYEFVTYLSLVGSLFVGKHFEEAGVFIRRANNYLKKTENASFDEIYLKESKKFLKRMSSYLIENNLLSEELSRSLTENKDL